MKRIWNIKHILKNWQYYIIPKKIGKFYLNRDGNKELMIIAFIGILESLVVLFSLGSINPTWRADYIFSDKFMEND